MHQLLGIPVPNELQLHPLAIFTTVVNRNQKHDCNIVTTACMNLNGNLDQILFSEKLKNYF